MGGMRRLRDIVLFVGALAMGIGLGMLAVSVIMAVLGAFLQKPILISVGVFLVGFALFAVAYRK